MTDRDYAIKSMKEITFQMASHAQDYLEVTIERHYTDIKELMTSYQKLILENQIVLEELDMECQEKINEDMANAPPCKQGFSLTTDFTWRILLCTKKFLIRFNLLRINGISRIPRFMHTVPVLLIF